MKLGYLTIFCIEVVAFSQTPASAVTIHLAPFPLVWNQPLEQIQFDAACFPNDQMDGNCIIDKYINVPETVNSCHRADGNSVYCREWFRSSVTFLAKPSVTELYLRQQLEVSKKQYVALVAQESLEKLNAGYNPARVDAAAVSCNRCMIAAPNTAAAQTCFSIFLEEMK